MEEQFKKIEKQVNVTTNKIVGLNVQARREQLGWTSDTLAHKANVDRSYLSRIETGKVSCSYFILLKLVHALELPSIDSLCENANEAVKDFIHEINKEE